MDNSSSGTGFLQRHYPFLQALIFFSVYFLFILIYVQPGVICTFNGVHKFSYILEFTKEYAAGILTVPGGLTKLAITLLIEACRLPWLGALLITGIAWLLFYLPVMIGKKAGGSFLSILSFVWYVPPLLLLLVVSRYELHYFPAIVAAVGSLLFYALFQRLAFRSSIIRAVFFAVLTLFSFYAFSLAGLLFAPAGVFLEYRASKKTFLSIVIAGLVVVGLIILCKFFIFPFDQIFNYSTMLDFNKPVLYLYLCPFIFALLSGVSLPGKTEKKTKAKKAARLNVGAISAAAGFLATAALLTGVMVFTVQNRATTNIRSLGQVLYFARHEQWDKILDMRKSGLFRGFPAKSTNTQLMVTHALYRALYHTGQLSSNMLTFPQSSDPEPLLLFNTSWLVYFPAWAHGIDIAQDLGSTALAEKLLGEAMENMGPHPFLIYRRARVQIARENRELAAAYLQKLRHMPEYGISAGRLLDEIAKDSSGAADTGVARLRCLMDREDFILNNVNEEKLFISLLRSNRANKMAFEYLMAYYLLSRRPDKVAKLIYRLDDFGYAEMPRLYQEALVVFQREHPDSSATLRLPKAVVAKETFERGDRFIKALEAYGNNPGAEKGLLAEFGNTYFYLYTFGYIPGGKP
jgi:hypothetical protein